MPETPVRQSFPRRDEHGRAVSVAELTFAGVASAVVTLIAVAAVDGILVLFGANQFGRASGWLGLILPALVYFDDLRGWRGHGVRFLVAIVSAVVAIGLGLIVAGQIPAAPLVSGGVGALVASALYSPAWFFGVRWLTGEHSEMRSR